MFESYSLDFGVIFLDYTNISRKGGGVQKHNLSLYTDLVFRKHSQTERQSDGKTNLQIDVKTDREEVRQTDSTVAKNLN